MNPSSNTASAQPNPLGVRPLPRLLRSFAIPSVLAMLVSSLYNIVDQIFIGNGVGYLGNAATNVAFPLTTICLSIALLIGVGGAARFNLSLGHGDNDQARRTVGAAFSMMVVLGLSYMVIVELFLPYFLRLFGATAEVMPYATDYTRITAVGMPLLIITNAMSNLARADGSPRYSMTCMLLGAVINTILDPIFIFVCHWGVAGAAWATVIGQAASFLMALNYLRLFRNIRLTLPDFRPSLREWKCIASLGLSNSCNQLAITFVQIVLNNSLTYYGALSVYGSEIPLAASGIVIKVNAILTGIIVGISQGTQPIISFNYGAGQYAGCGAPTPWPSRSALPSRRWALWLLNVSPGRSWPCSAPAILCILSSQSCSCGATCSWWWSTACSCCPPTSSRPSASPSGACCCP